MIITRLAKTVYNVATGETEYMTPDKKDGELLEGNYYDVGL